MPPLGGAGRRSLLEVWIGAACLGVLAGCAQRPSKDAMIQVDFVKVSEPDRLHGEVLQLLNRAYGDIVGTASEIAARSADRKVRENALRMKITTSYAFQAIVRQTDPRLLCLQTWLALVQARQNVTQGALQSRFGDQQQLIVDISKRLEQDFIDIALRHFEPSLIERMKPKIEDLASRRPMTAHMAEPYVAATPQSAASEFKQFSEVLSVPLATFSGLRGIGDTPSAINRIGDEASEFTDMVRHLPERARWEVELLLLEVESTETLAGIRRNSGTIVETLEAARRDLETLPAKASKEMERVLASAEKIQPELRATLEETRKATGEISNSLQKANDVAESLGKTARELTATAAAWDSAAKSIKETVVVIDDFGKDDPEKEPSPGPPLTIRDYTDFALKIDVAAKQLRDLLMELKAPLPADSTLKQTIETAGSTAGSSVAQAVKSGEDLIYAATWRVLGIVVVAFLVALAYRRITMNWPRRGEGGKAA